MEVLSSTALAKHSAPVSVIPALHPKLPTSNRVIDCFEEFILVRLECLNYTDNMELTVGFPPNLLVQVHKLFVRHCQ